MMRSLSNIVICFDLDDTLYKEIDYLKSAFAEIASYVRHPEAKEQMLNWYNTGDNTFTKLIEIYGLNISVADLLKIYREHIPSISLDVGVKELLVDLKSKGAMLGIITDGRKVTQHNKINALSLKRYLDMVIISEEIGTEKPSLVNYKIVMERFSGKEKFIYVGDNTQKDFLAPNKLGWDTICLLDNGCNIHKQVFDLPKEFLPKVQIGNIKELVKLI